MNNTVTEESAQNQNSCLAASMFITVDERHALAIQCQRSGRYDQVILAIFPASFVDQIELRSILLNQEIGRSRLIMQFIHKGNRRMFHNVGAAVLEVMRGEHPISGQEVHHKFGQGFNRIEDLEVVWNYAHPRKVYDEDVISGLVDIVGYTSEQVDRIIENCNFLIEKFPKARHIKPMGVSLANTDLTHCEDWKDFIIAK